MEGTIHIDRALTNVSIGYSNGDFIADQVAPVVPVDFKSDKYYVYGKERFRQRDDRRSAGSEAKKSRFTLSNDSYGCEGHALMDELPREDQKNADPAMDLMIDTTEQLTEQMKLNKEAALVAMLVAGMISASLADQASSQWSSNTYNPVALILAQAAIAQKRTGKRPNRLALSQPVWDAITQNTNVTSRITGAANLQDSRVTVDQFANLLNLDGIDIGSAMYDTANEGQAATLDWVWSDYALLYYRPRVIGRKMLSLASQFLWSGAGQAIGAANVGGQFVRRWYEDRRIIDVVEVNEYYDLKLITKDAGCLFTNCV
jgi:hypothetical protein